MLVDGLRELKARKLGEWGYGCSATTAGSGSPTEREPLTGARRAVGY